jgi:hypothetical protein
MRTRRSGLTCTEETVHEETKPTALRRDEAHVQLIINHVNGKADFTCWCKSSISNI